MTGGHDDAGPRGPAVRDRSPALVDYRFGAVDVRCDVVLPGYSRYLRRADGETPTPDAVPSARPTITIRRVPTPPPAGPDDRFLLRLPTRRGPVEVRTGPGGTRVVTAAGLAPYTLYPGRRVSWHGARDPSAAEADHLVATILPWTLASDPDSPVLHAGALVGPTGAVLLCGASGAGKSTLSAALHRRLGWPLLGDDAALLRLVDGQPYVLSCSREVRLWDDAGRLLGMGTGIPLPRYGTKSRHPVDGAADRPVRVAAVIRIDAPPPASGTAALGRLHPIDGILLLRSGRMRTEAISVADAAREFDFLTRWSGSVGFAALRYPHVPTALDEAVGLLADLAATLGPRT